MSTEHRNRLLDPSPVQTGGLAEIRALLEQALSPVNMVLHCPACGLQHIDSPERSLGPGNTETLDWDNPPHRSHLCAGCGHIWRPADVPTNGVEAIKTKGKNDSPAPTPRAVPEEFLAHRSIWRKALTVARDCAREDLDAEAHRAWSRELASFEWVFDQLLGAGVQPLPDHADHIPEIAARLRRVARLAGVAALVPADDRLAVGAIFAVLGAMAGAIERKQAREVPQPGNQSALYLDRSASTTLPFDAAAAPQPLPLVLFNRDGSPIGTPQRTVDDLQRELLAICRGGSFAESWRKLNAPTEWPSLRGEMEKLARVSALRKHIRALNPDAALYYGWAGPGDEKGPV